MKRIIITYLIFLLSITLSGQTVGKIGGIEDPARIGSVRIDSIKSLSGFILDITYKSCKEILANNPTAADGIYTIDPDSDGAGEPFDCYCDMTTDGGGWTLVLLSNAGVTGCPRPYWNEVVNNINLNGTLSANLTSFDLFLGVKHWNLIGNKVRLDMGASPANLSHRAYYDFSLDETNYYSLNMSNESITIHTEGTESPGMYTYHNGRPLSSRDADHDAYSNNCSNNYYESAWWYGNCFSGSFWGGGSESFQDAPYWTESMAEYFNYGAIWLR